MISIVTDGDHIGEISRQIYNINITLRHLTKVIDAQSFWNSQLFAAILGAFSAIVIQQGLTWLHKRKESLDKTYRWVAEQHVFWSPDSLLNSAENTSYGSPDKPLGEKMIIDLRSHVKYWRYPYSKIKKQFAKYEKSLHRFNDFGGTGMPTKEDCLKISNSYFESIKNISFKKSGENEWTR